MKVIGALVCRVFALHSNFNEDALDLTAFPAKMLTPSLAETMISEVRREQRESHTDRYACSLYLND